MSDPRRIVELYVNVDLSVLTDENGSIITTRTAVFRRSQVLFRCHLKLDDGTTYFTPPAGTQWVFMIDNSYSSTHPDLVVSDNAQFNIGSDWGDLDADNGKICWRINTATDALTTEMGEAASKQMSAELWMLPIAGDPSLIIQFLVDVKNIVGDVGADAGLIYTNTNMLKFDGDDIVLLFPDGSVAQRWSRS